MEKLFSILLLIVTRMRWKFVRPKTRQHHLPQELIVSLTSHAPRFATLLPTLQCLLSQSIRPDKVILWIDEKDGTHLPQRIKNLEARGLTILKTGNEIGPYKKIIPALLEFPEAVIVTADDDLYYRPTWLEELVKSWNGSKRQIACHRAHRIRMLSPDQPMPYHQWEFETPGPLDATDIFPTGVGGVLYPPHSLDPQVTDEETFIRVSPKADDVWLFWMARRNGTAFHKTNVNKPLYNWPRSQIVNLYTQNIAHGGNDQKINAMISAFGWPK